MIFMMLQILFLQLKIDKGLKIACLEEIALNNKWINKKTSLKSHKFLWKM